ncbi:nucleotidyltransferase domain-containing protein [Halosimplex halophilum]|uniref:nucleotidyltransferase domain-containing protein n=1 Tax=Halosimplex halophilum TaxID=2559572 RepID=UPI001435674F|nr:nucleotidyltransferase domain-containing protein [Halosimplex halophilum]
MTGSDERRSAIDAPEATVCSDPAVEFAVVFGSQIAGEPNRSSDLDVAVKFADDLSDRERFEKRCFLSGDLQREDAPFVDLSDIEMLPVDIARDAVDGRFLCGDERAFERFRADIEATFAERRDTIRDHQHDVIDRIAEDGLRG